MKNYSFFFGIMLFACVALLLPACKGPDQPAGSKEGSDQPAASKQANQADPGLVMTVLYQQQAAEYRALCLQAYAIARKKVAASVNGRTDKDSLAIITDLDETALDNSAFEAQLILDDTAYSGRRFTEWVKMKKAGAVPGSVAFFRFVNDLNRRLKKKIDIFYVSNRDAALLEPTMENMSRLGFPQVTAGHFLLNTGPKDPSKESRRQTIGKNHAILLLLGDNLIDLDAAFDSHKKLTGGDRLHRVDSLANYWGDKYIVLPNAMYGDWESALYNYRYLSRDSIGRTRRDSLRGYNKF